MDVGDAILLAGKAIGAGLAMVGAAVVPLSTAYAVTESLGWESGLGRRIREAPLFIGVYTAVIVIAGLILYMLRAWRNREWPFGATLPSPAELQAS